MRLEHCSFPCDRFRRSFYICPTLPVPVSVDDYIYSSSVLSNNFVTLVIRVTFEDVLSTGAPFMLNHPWFAVKDLAPPSKSIVVSDGSLSLAGLVTAGKA